MYGLLQDSSRCCQRWPYARITLHKMFVSPDVSDYCHQFLLCLCQETSKTTDQSYAAFHDLVRFIGSRGGRSRNCRRGTCRRRCRGVERPRQHADYVTVHTCSLFSTFDFGPDAGNLSARQNLVKIEQILCSLILALLSGGPPDGFIQCSSVLKLPSHLISHTDSHIQQRSQVGRD